MVGTVKWNPMDISQYLPLSQRPRVDETGVTNNWSRAAAPLLLSTAELLETATAAEWDASTERQGASVRDVARDLIARAGQGTPDRADKPKRTDAQLAERMRELALERMTGHPRTGVALLGDILIGAWDIAESLGASLEVPPTVTGAVALARSQSAPFAIRSVVKVRRLVATDADWKVGFGPELLAPAEAIVKFLYGRGGTPGA
jgi:hypothetical protein